MRRLTSFLLCACTAACASPVRVTSDYDPDLDFEALSSYRWLPTPEIADWDPRLDNSLLQDRVHRAVDATLEKRDMTRRESDPVDFYLIYYAILEQKLDIHTSSGFSGPGWGWGAGTAAHTSVANYDEGTLILDIMNSKTKKIMWRGTASAELFQESTPEKRSEAIREAVERMLEQFPP
jgi:hypothetical protein